VVSAAARAISDSPSQEIARQADKDLALAVANVGDLELMTDNAIRAMLNARIMLQSATNPVIYVWNAGLKNI